MAREKKEKKRRGNGQGSRPYLRSDGRYESRYFDASGKRRSVYGKTSEECNDRLVEALHARRTGIVYSAGTMTFSAFLDGWLEDEIEGSAKERTLMAYRQHAEKHLKPALGRVKLASLTRAHFVRLHREKLAEGLSAQTVLGIHSVARNALGKAVEWDLIPRNPAEKARPPRPRGSLEEIRPLTRSQARDLLAVAAKAPRYSALYALALATGLRHGELLALRWQDVTHDERTEGGTLAVRRSLGPSRSKKDGGEVYAFTTPKTGRNRVVAFGPSVALSLKEHHKRQLTEPANINPRAAGLVFRDESGDWLAPHKSQRLFRKLATRAQLPPETRFHDLRHTAATLALASGVYPKVVQEMLGHAKISQTLDTYSHVVKSMQDDAARRMDGELFG